MREIAIGLVATAIAAAVVLFALAQREYARALRILDGSSADEEVKVVTQVPHSTPAGDALTRQQLCEQAWRAYAPDVSRVPFGEWRPNPSDTFTVAFDAGWAARGTGDETRRLREALAAHHEALAFDGWCLTCGERVPATPSSEPQEAD